MKQKVIAFLGMGSNLAQPMEQLQAAVDSLQAEPEIDVLKVSSFYGSKPLGPQDQPDYVNAVAKITTTLAAEELLSRLQEIEAQQGRIKKRHWGERLIDLDILCYGQEHIDLPHLQIPHSQIAHRDFVLLPLAEIAPDLSLPGLPSLQQMIAELQERFVTVLS